jgi:hypothetical protein
MKAVVFLLSLFVFSAPAIADNHVKLEKVETEKEVKKENPHKQLHLYFLDRRPYTAPKNDNSDKNSSRENQK